MTKWEWWAGDIGETYHISGKTRDEVIAAGLRDTEPGEDFQIVEARSSTDQRYEGADHVPFVRERNHEVISASMKLAS